MTNNNIKIVLFASLMVASILNMNRRREENIGGVMPEQTFEVCNKCGFVITDKISDGGSERKSFSTPGGVDTTRTGAPTSLTVHDKGLATVINPINRDASGNPLYASMKSTIERLRTWDTRSKAVDSADRNLRQALTELSTLKNKLSLSAAVNEKAAYIYRKALEKKLIRGQSISAMIAASLYAACRDTETPRTLQDVAISGNIKRKDIARCYRLLHRELELKIPVVDSTLCIARIASKASISEKTKRYSIKILKAAQENKESAGKNPMGLAAAALYLACIQTGESKTQKNISDASGVTEVTVRNRCKSLRASQNIDF